MQSLIDTKVTTIANQDWPYAMLWSTGSGGETICITRYQMDVFPFGGRCDDACEALAAEVKATHGEINYDELRADLVDAAIGEVYDMDDDSVLRYTVFMAAWDLFEYDDDKINDFALDEEQYAEYLRSRQ